MQRHPIASVAIALSLLAAASPAAPAHVTFNQDQVLLIDGRKLFPIGFTMPPPPDGLAPSGKPAYQELRDAGGTFIRTGPNRPPGWDDDAFAMEQKYQDAAAKYGLYCLPWLREATSPVGLPKTQRRLTDAEREALLRKIIGRFKDHPGMGLWKGADEPDWGKAPIEPLARTYQMIHELDPNHPVWIVQAPRGSVESMRRYDTTYDVTGMDVYPISYPPGTHSLLRNKEISMVGDYTREMMQVAGAKKPVWMTLQIAWSGVSKPGKTLRMPTFPHERFMAYQAIINGARGLVFFGGNVPQAWSPRDTELQWNWSFWERVLRPLLEEIGDKGPLSSALVAPNSPLPIKVEGAGSESIEFIARETDDAVFILACKREGATVNVKFTGLPAGITTADVLYESPRKVEAKERAFSDWFAPFEVHVYRFARR